MAKYFYGSFDSGVTKTLKDACMQKTQETCQCKSENEIRRKWRASVNLIFMPTIGFIVAQKAIVGIDHLRTWECLFKNNQSNLWGRCDTEGNSRHR